MKFKDLNLLDIGNTIQLNGAIFSGEKTDILCFFPGEQTSALILTDHELDVLDMTIEEWKIFLRQTDIMETEILAKDSSGKIAKAIYRKSQRQIDQRVSWKVFKRDQYKCRYCGNDNVPLTVDHIVLWEEGGPTTEENLVSACKKCNKTRGSIQYKDWLDSNYYLRGIEGLDLNIVKLNKALVDKIDTIEKVIHKKSR